jgi:hypothetical protein
MNKKKIAGIINKVKSYLQEMYIQDGEIFFHSDQNYRLHFSPYRLTMEIRCPEVIHKLEK